MTAEFVRQLLIVALTVAAVVALSSQCRKPRWWLGRLNVWMMNARHSTVTDWGLKEVHLERHFTILDAGCGGGRTVDKLAAIASEGKVYGIDYSAASVSSARRTNSRWIESGRVEIKESSVSHLPFPDCTFDLVTAVETHYYWPDLVADLREIQRVLKPGGRLVIIAEAYRGRPMDTLYRPVMKLLRARYLTVEEHRESFSAAGYSDIAVREEHDKGWICVVGRRPLQSA